MPLIGASLVTNSPYLLPGLKGAVRLPLAKTWEALGKLTKIITKAKADVVMIVTETAEGNDGLYFWQQSKYQAVFNTVGDLVTTKDFSGAVGLIHSVRESLETKLNIPLRSTDLLPTDIALPLTYLNINMPVAPLVLNSSMSVNSKITAAEWLLDFLHTRSEKIWLLAAGLPAVRSKNNDSDFKIYLTALRKILKTGNYDHLLDLEKNLRQQVRETLLLPLSFVYGLSPYNCKTVLLADEEAHNIQHLTGHITW